MNASKTSKEAALIKALVNARLAPADSSPIVVSQQDQQSYDAGMILNELISLSPQDWLLLCVTISTDLPNGPWFSIKGCKAFPLYEMQRQDDNYFIKRFIKGIMKVHGESITHMLLQERASIMLRLTATLTGMYQDDMFITTRGEEYDSRN